MSSTHLIINLKIITLQIPSSPIHTMYREIKDNTNSSHAKIAQITIHSINPLLNAYLFNILQSYLNLQLFNLFHINTNLFPTSLPHFQDIKIALYIRQLIRALTNDNIISLHIQVVQIGLLMIIVLFVIKWPIQSCKRNPFS